MKRFRFPFLCLLAALPGCIGTKMVPPPAPPVAIAPTSLRSEDPPPKDGRGRVVLDVAGTVATAFEIQEKKDDPDGRTVEALCDTPCAVSLSLGKHPIAFVSPKGLVGRETVEVLKSPTVVREQLGYVKTHPVLWYSGALAACTGVIGVLLGLVLVGQGEGPDRDPAAVKGAHEAGAGVLIGSAGLFGLAWFLLHVGRTEIQPSAMTTFPEARP